MQPSSCFSFHPRTMLLKAESIQAVTEKPPPSSAGKETFPDKHNKTPNRIETKRNGTQKPGRVPRERVPRWAGCSSCNRPGEISARKGKSAQESFLFFYPFRRWFGTPNLLSDVVHLLSISTVLLTPRVGFHAHFSSSSSPWPSSFVSIVMTITL